MVRSPPGEESHGGDDDSSSIMERDESVDEDMEALRRACAIAGRAPSDGGDYSGGESSDSEDDLDLLRSIQQRFALPLTAQTPLVLEPLSAISPTDSEDEDFQTLRAIQRRFTQYENDSMKERNDGSSIQGSLGVLSSMPEKESSCHLLENGNGLPKSCEPAILIQSEDGSDDFSSTRYTYSRFPYCGQKFVDALKINRSCQIFIRGKLIEIEAKIESIKELKKRAKCLMGLQFLSKRKTARVLSQKRDPRVRLISLPKRRRSSKAMNLEPLPLNYGPPENPHVSTYRMILERFSFFLCKRMWSKAEKENLTKGIKQQYQERALLASMELSSDSGVLEKSIVTLRNNNEFTPDDIRFFLPLTNWDRLASMYLPGRSGADCESRWLNHEDPIINRDQWTANEEKKLLHIVQTKGIYNWIEISVSLGTHRTPFQCLTHYQRSLNPRMLKKDWTDDEDSRLRAAVEVHGDGDWQLVASYLEGRTGPQCSIRWRNCLHPNRRKVGRWSVDEDKRLKVAVIIFGAKNWHKIAHFVPGRTQSQCRERWVNCLDPALNFDAWTEEEDTKLREAISAYGYSWSKVASFVPPRTDNQCRRRWKILFPDEVLLHQAAWKVQKTFLITNFVDRESERPLIGPRDFCVLQSDAPQGGTLKITTNDDNQASSHKSEITPKRIKRRLGKVTEAECINHERETVPKKREKRLDQVTKEEGMKGKRKWRSSNASLEETPPPLYITNHEREIAPKRRKRRLDKVTEAEGINHERETVPKKREKRLDQVTKEEGTKSKCKRRSSNARLEETPPSLYITNHEREISPKRRKRRLVQVTEAEGVNHETETVPKKREKRLDQLTIEDCTKSNANLEETLPSPYISDHEREIAPKRRKRRLGKVPEAEGLNHERGAIPKKKEKVGRSN